MKNKDIFRQLSILGFEKLKLMWDRMRIEQKVIIKILYQIQYKKQLLKSSYFLSFLLIISYSSSSAMAQHLRMAIGEYECLSNSQCEVEEYCNIDSHTCVAFPVCEVCEQCEQCETCETCEICETCPEPIVCAEDEFNLNGECVKCLCDSDCSKGRCNETHECIECESDEECESGYVCQSNQCRELTCDSIGYPVENAFYCSTIIFNGSNSAPANPWLVVGAYYSSSRNRTSKVDGCEDAVLLLPDSINKRVTISDSTHMGVVYTIDGVNYSGYNSDNSYTFNLKKGIHTINVRVPSDPGYNNFQMKLPGNLGGKVCAKEH